MSSTMLVFLGPMKKKTRWLSWPLIDWHIFDFSSETTERNSRKLDRKQDLNVIYKICVFDSSCFWGRSEKSDGHPGLADSFSTSPLKPLNRIQQKLTWSKVSTYSTKFVFLGQIRKTRWLPWPLIGWDIFNFSSETVQWNSSKLNRKQDLNVLYHVCVFQADRKNKIAALANPSKRWHIELRCTICGPLGLLFLNPLFLLDLKAKVCLKILFFCFQTMGKAKSLLQQVKVKAII